MSRSARVTDADAERLEQYLRREAAEGEAYIKSKFVADEVDLTPSQVGLLLTRLRESDDGVDVEKWSYTNATTWRVRAGD
ncbi:hypothetical protein BRD11_01720 [Halobacteriales archaeon SW_12_69_24]|nr:MAG: hypothetical protein BRD11_01720 [Halobacteriales archaeon SW_12_69_24]